jgi:hypothetical protein
MSKHKKKDGNMNAEMKHGHTGRISRHGMPAHGSHKDAFTHASHHEMNAKHGTPKGMHAAEEYDEGSGNSSYHGSEGQGVPGSMEHNETMED